MITKTITLYPTHIKCDIWVGRITKKVKLLWKSKYGLEDKDIDLTTPNECSIVQSSYKSELKGEERIFLVISNLDEGLIAHETYHILKHLCKITGITTDYRSQEWSAYFIETIFNEIKNKKTYEKV
jgi:hypothetical protein